VTAAEVRTPSSVPAPSAPAWRAVPGVRLVWLHWRSRRVPAAVLALAVCSGVLCAALRLQWTFNSGHFAQELPMIVEGGAAAVLVVTTHSPFGEPERTASRWLPSLRLGTALAMTGVAIGILQLGVTGVSLDGGVLVLARNVLGVTGIGLLSSLVTGGLLAWILPMGYIAFAEYALLQSWTSPWTWPVRPPDDRGAWLCACLVFVIGLAAVTIRGARTRLADDS
jgi:hypothetical protein